MPVIKDFSSKQTSLIRKVVGSITINEMAAKLPEELEVMVRAANDLNAFTGVTHNIHMATRFVAVSRIPADISNEDLREICRIAKAAPKVQINGRS